MPTSRKFSQPIKGNLGFGPVKPRKLAAGVRKISAIKSPGGGRGLAKGVSGFQK